jgi:3-deoxy-manno-octulosonate cytidylyltransferase (CMP-KDO synthetase)
MSTESLQAIAVIPARYASTRFPGKPLTQIAEISMLQRVFLQAQMASSISKVIIATDDDRIARHANHIGASVVMTSPLHQSGTDRIAEVMQQLNLQCDVVVNVQGDEPFIDPEQINQLVHAFDDKYVQIATMIKRITTIEEYQNPNCVKTVIGQNGNALYFSRSPIPYVRHGNLNDVITQNHFYKHIGMYAYRPHIIQEIAALPAAPLETIESLEQLRWLQAGYTLRTVITTQETISIDTPDDVLKAEQYLQSK